MDNSNSNNKPNMPKMPKFNMTWLYIFVIIALGVVFFARGNGLMSSSAGVDRDYTTFKQYVEKGYGTKVIINKDDNTLRMFVSPDHIRDIFKSGTDQVGTAPYVTVQIGSVDKVESFLDQAVAHKKIASYSYENKSDSGLMDILFSIGPWILIFAIWYFIMRRMSSGVNGAGGVFNVGKSKAKLYEKANEMGITFKDVAGQTGAKQEVQEIVDFLKNPKKYTDLGGKIPKGALLIGPPGTGKTLLAKAVAGEAGVPFFSMSGSDFVEMFVGVGASRVRDVFRQAKEKSPCIIFIDEIDAVGRARSKNPAMGGNDERENTLNALLTEMDGFGTNSGVIVLAATNRVDMLDKALLRAGRFDRQIHVDLPDLPERKEIFLVHMRNLKLHKDLDIDLLARQTPGFSGADIANVCNEAALIAARHNSKEVTKQDFLDAVDRIIGGLEKKTKVMTTDEKRTIALHEAGHATISWFCEHANPLVKVSIVPRGQALGAAWYLPEERPITTKEQMLDEMCSLLGGRAAEELFTGHISTGAMNDLERATKSAYGMIAYAGMSDRLPNICYYNNDEYNFQKPYSETTAKTIDEEVLKMINDQYDRAKQILLDHKEGHNRLAQLLVEREVIMAEDVEEIFGKRPWVSRTQELLEQEEKSQPKLEDMPEEVKKAQAEHEAKLAQEAKEQSEEAETNNTAE
ncbi:MAG: ATP-dependent metallopeptidase FtsH/Yme1/Tma family protein [Prevotella histicola]|jgi:ATP-dependent metallopeptidase hflB|uniref:ATP-dependent zinc metalloprotease FtsH n=1 Tax=Prevotella histicola TaxID=470565 RepID=A0A930I0A1_9BACT|nr:ATP-dependent zinc metalloprotease FtsH [Prevotella histicola]MBF1392875.1 ATP-dependent metallopeptidase FtsH/Yme1/Tma family protein [Prevotella histicola]MBF1393386.1 ATP-dependent metallopeptidase FtsH/Yme1/Tma family protein [Prevotella histicola]MBF1397341.1 ATP-dependent metallopeptidase FtsH/Yme1/Tma family protein [Prevotella histicola]MBF1400152.1 ATP-dependent metallopeptidase FtsH/Yme1/Tma family protein [Prevotella histicola]MBF1407795.1 ATP-dependent metallopeptidase FtsH/Yme1